jgi:hypothetical protein
LLLGVNRTGPLEMTQKQDPVGPLRVARMFGYPAFMQNLLSGSEIDDEMASFSPGPRPGKSRPKTS